MVDRVASAEQMKVGTRVLGRWTDRKYCPGTITRVAEDGNYDIVFDDGDRKIIGLGNLRLLSE